MSAPPPLAALQLATLDALYGAPADPALLDAMRPARALMPSEALSIYRNALRSTLLNALRLSYPICERLVGAGFFATAAAAYIDVTPSRHGDLDCYGDGFGSFLESYAPAKDLPYLPDVARFEWLAHRLRRAPAANAFDHEALRQSESSDLADCAFPLIPRADLFTSPYPAVRIWQAHVRNMDDPQFAAIDERDDRVLVIAGDSLRVIDLDEARYCFYFALQQGHTLDEAVRSALAANGDFDFDATFKLTIELEVLAVPGMVTHFSNEL